MLPDKIDPYFTAFYYYMKKNGFNITEALYVSDVDAAKNGEKYTCLITFAKETNFNELINFMKLPKRNTRTFIQGFNLEAEDGSYMIQRDSVTGCLSMMLAESHHVAVLCYIMSNT